MHNKGMNYYTARYWERKNKLTMLLGGKCSVCGSTQDLHFHHKNKKDKSFTICNGLTKPWKILLVEIAKCILLCGVCHKLEHPATHGLTMYSHYGCRCDVCKKEWSLRTLGYKRKQKARAKEQEFLRNKDEVKKEGILESQVLPYTQGA